MKRSWGKNLPTTKKNLSDALRHGSLQVIPRLDKYIQEGAYEQVNQVVDEIESYPPEQQEQIRRALRESGLMEKYKNDLKNVDYKVRAVTAERLGKLGGAGVPEQLFQAMADNNEEVRLAATAALKKVVDPTIAGLLVGALKEPNKWLPARVAEVLISLGQAAVPALHAALDETDPLSMGYVIEILGEIGDKSSADLLHRALRNSSGNIRLQAAGALGKIGHRASVPLLVKALRDPEIKVKVQAVRSLGIIGGAEAAHHLAEMLTDGNPVVRYSALDALRHLGGEGIQYIEAVASTEGHPAAEEAKKVIKEEKNVAGTRVNIMYKR